MSEHADPRFYKVLVRLPHDANGYPTSSVEGLWAQCLKGVYRIDSLPFHAYDIAPGDLVSVRREGPVLWVDQVLHAIGGSMLRVRIKAGEELEEMQAALQAFACPCELERSTRLLAIHVPAQVSIDPLLYFLLMQREAGTLDFEEGVLRHALPDGLPLG
ncbi:DUF4265 domain-containing protein [Pseudomonas phoenicis]|uniref:DUF4265 domain-containing protein n=1 Tax=unclassified Pseudomonas TaxID=196821 RepID=UPI00399F28D9